MKLAKLSGIREEMHLVEQYIQAFLPAAGNNEKVNEIIQAVTASRGKRLRPQLVLLAGRLGPDYPSSRERLCKIGAILEMVHMASLIHDDIIDDSPLRRGMPTIQSRFGKDMAVYTGDLILGRVMQTLFRENLTEAGIHLGTTVEEMCLGEIGQFDCRFRTDVTVQAYLSNIYGKTVSMFELTCYLGGLASGCSPDVTDALKSAGRNLGYMFQIRDDLLDFISDTSNEGKPVHMDFQEGIFTLPVIYGLANPDYHEALAQLAVCAERGTLTKNQINELDDLILHSGGLKAALQTMNNHKKTAETVIKVFDNAEVSAVFRELLKRLSLPEVVDWRNQERVIC